MTVEERLILALEGLSDILHELEEVGAELTDAQEHRWSEATTVLQSLVGYRPKAPPGFDEKKAKASPPCGGSGARKKPPDLDEDRIKTLAREAAKSGGIAKTGFHWDQLARLEKAIADAIRTAMGEADGRIVDLEHMLSTARDARDAISRSDTRHEAQLAAAQAALAITKPFVLSARCTCGQYSRLPTLDKCAACEAREALAKMGDKT